jgi:glutamate-1-semialdehyde 2,1-aminomutase
MTTVHEPAFDREALLAKAEAVLPWGASAGGRPVFRRVIARSAGAYLWTPDGTRYIDHLMAHGAIVIGHSDPLVNAAVTRSIAESDLHWVGPQSHEVELAERLVALVPSAEKVVFVNTGTDALAHALHVARAATGRGIVVKFHGHYHGWAGELGIGANFDVRPGRVPRRDAPNTAGSAGREAGEVIVLDWNDADGFREAFREYGDAIAAVFAEPYLHSYTNAPPAPGFLELLREVTAERGAVLVFDEVKTGFRHHLGGYQAIAGVTPDLTALGKAMGNGYTVAALVGRGDLMGLLGARVTIDGTYYANPYALAAALATIDLLEAGAIEWMYLLGERLRVGLRRAIQDAGVIANVTGIGSAWIVNWRAEPPVTFEQAVDADLERGEAFRVAMLDAGIVLPPYVITDARIAAAFTEDDIDETIAAAERAMRMVA